MPTAPYGVRLLLGAAVTALDESRKLPQTIVTYPMTVVSQVAQLVMKVQQDVADLVNRGDETLEHLFPPKDEQAGWATFDEDAAEDSGDTYDSGDAESGGGAPVTGRTGRVEGERLTEGRFALYSTGEPDRDRDRDRGGAPPPGAVPAIVDELDYSTLTLAQLRARLAALRVSDLVALLDYEETTTARAPFQTLLANRITRASAT